MVVETVLLSESFLRRWTLRRDGFQGWSTIDVLRLDEQQLAYRGEDMLRDIGWLNTRFFPSCNCRLLSHQNSLDTNIRPGEIVTVRSIPNACLIVRAYILRCRALLVPPLGVNCLKSTYRRLLSLHCPSRCCCRLFALPEVSNQRDMGTVCSRRHF
ncbi:hypothetical protein CPB85DRAFT_134856 [Mucidula mucida]|nr:hypothetical protein CPB85DRAFT_134856 [Mucidula mucida]